MKNMLKLSTILSFVFFLAACSSGSDKVTGSASLTDDLAGKYSREYKKNQGDYFNLIKDTIVVIKKDQNFEIAEHRWYKPSNEPEKAYVKVGGFHTFQGVFNQTDTTISHPQGGSIKFDVAKSSLTFPDNPEMVYIKVK
jgi:hypothetical protein